MEDLSPSSTRVPASSDFDQRALEHAPEERIQARTEAQEREQEQEQMETPVQAPVTQVAGKVRFRIPKFSLSSGMEGALSEVATVGSAF